MADDPIALLERTLNDADAAPSAPEPVEWPEIMNAMKAILALPRSAARDALLERLLAPGRELRIVPSQHGPHAMSPRDMLRFLAVQALSVEEVEHVRPHLENIVAEPEYPGPVRVESARRLGR